MLNTLLKKLISNNRTYISYSNHTRRGMKNNIYVPHPFTNWSLNPSYKNKLNTHDHTIEGFRKTSEKSNLINYNNNKQKKIYCLGGSTTYCTELDSYKDSWPYKLSCLYKNNNIDVINGGVGGWGTLQSLIRLTCWGPIVKPELTIIYQAKNDLTFYYNGDENEDEIYPDYSNIIGHLPNYNKNKIIYRLFNINLSECYGKSFSPKPQNLSRYNNSSLEGSITRYLAIADLVSQWNGKVLFIPEIILGSEYQLYIEKLNSKAISILEKKSNCTIFDIDNFLIKDSNHFMDKMHFTNLGCDVFSDLLYNFIKKDNLL